MGKGAASQAGFAGVVFFCAVWTVLFGYFFFVALGRTLYDPSAYLEATCTLRGGNETSMIYPSARGDTYGLYVNLAVRVAPKDPTREHFDASGNNCGITDWANNCGEEDGTRWTWATCDRDPWCDVSVAVPKECVDDKTEPCPRWRNESTPATRWCSKPCAKDQCSNHTLPIGRSFACWYDGERNFVTTPSEWPAKYVGSFDAGDYQPLGVRFMAPTAECDYNGKEWGAMTVFLLIGFVCGALPLGCLLLLALGIAAAGLSQCLLKSVRSRNPAPAGPPVEKAHGGKDTAGTGVVLHDIEQD